MLTQRLKQVYGETFCAMQGIKMRCGSSRGDKPALCYPGLGLPTSKEYCGGLTAPLVSYVLAFLGSFRRRSQKRVVGYLQDGSVITHTKINLFAGCFSLRSP